MPGGCRPCAAGSQPPMYCPYAGGAIGRQAPGSCGRPGGRPPWGGIPPGMKLYCGAAAAAETITIGAIRHHHESCLVCAPDQPRGWKPVRCMLGSRDCSGAHAWHYWRHAVQPSPMPGAGAAAPAAAAGPAAADGGRCPSSARSSFGTMSTCTLKTLPHPHSRRSTIVDAGRAKGTLATNTPQLPHYA
jgi:hypothetical protein